MDHSGLFGKAPAGRNRRLIAACLEEQPGLGLRELMRRTGLPAGTLRHHLTSLTLKRRLFMREHGGQHLYFLGDEPDANEVLHAALRNLSSEHLRVLEFVAAHRGCSQSEAMNALARQGHARSTTQDRIRRLTQLGFLQLERNDLRRHAYHPTRLALEHLQQVGGVHRISITT